MTFNRVTSCIIGAAAGALALGGWALYRDIRDAYNRGRE